METNRGENERDRKNNYKTSVKSYVECITKKLQSGQHKRSQASFQFYLALTPNYVLIWKAKSPFLERHRKEGPEAILLWLLAEWFTACPYIILQICSRKYFTWTSDSLDAWKNDLCLDKTISLPQASTSLGWSRGRGSPSIPGPRAGLCPLQSFSLAFCVVSGQKNFRVYITPLPCVPMSLLLLSGSRRKWTCITIHEHKIEQSSLYLEIYFCLEAFKNYPLAFGSCALGKKRKCRCIPTGWEVLGAQFGGAEPTLHSDESQLSTHPALQVSGLLILLWTGLTLTYKWTSSSLPPGKSMYLVYSLEKSASPTQPRVSTTGGAGSQEYWFHVPPWSEPKAATSCQGALSRQLVEVCVVWSNIWVTQKERAPLKHSLEGARGGGE